MTSAANTRQKHKEIYIVQVYFNDHVGRRAVANETIEIVTGV